MNNKFILASGLLSLLLVGACFLHAPKEEKAVNAMDTWEETRKTNELAIKYGQTVSLDASADYTVAENGKYVRKTNHAGGIEGGMSNGENIVVKASMKAIPTMRKPLNSISIDEKTNVSAHFERSDTCAVSACAVVA